MLGHGGMAQTMVMKGRTGHAIDGWTGVDLAGVCGVSMTAVIIEYKTAVHGHDEER